MHRLVDPEQASSMYQQMASAVMGMNDHFSIDRAMVLTKVTQYVISYQYVVCGIDGFATQHSGEASFDV
jgi:hypothetical protein